MGLDINVWKNVRVAENQDSDDFDFDFGFSRWVITGEKEGGAESGAGIEAFGLGEIEGVFALDIAGAEIVSDGEADEIAAAAIYWLADEAGPISGSVVELEQHPFIGRNPPKDPETLPGQKA